MKMVYYVYNKGFWLLHKTHKLQCGKVLCKSVELSVCDAPYNIHRHQNLQNGDHDVFNAHDMEAFCEFAETSLKLGGHGSIVRSAVQFASWWWCFCARTENRGDGVGKTEVFEVEQTPLFISREHDIYLQDPQLKRLRYTNVAVQATYLWWKGLLFKYMHAHVCYDPLSEIKSSHHKWTNRVSNVLRVAQDERVFWYVFSASFSKVLPRPGLKNISRMKDIICKFTLPGGLVLACCADTFSGAKACIILPHHRRFVGCVLD